MFVQGKGTLQRTVEHEELHPPLPPTSNVARNRGHLACNAEKRQREHPELASMGCSLMHLHNTQQHIPAMTHRAHNIVTQQGRYINGQVLHRLRYLLLANNMFRLTNCYQDTEDSVLSWSMQSISAFRHVTHDCHLRRTLSKPHIQSSYPYQLY